MEIKQILEWTGCVISLTGAWLVGGRGKSVGYGFYAFLFSNCLWLSYGIATQTWGLVVMQSGFTVTSLRGIWNWRKNQKMLVSGASN